ncbi:hypothetical protein LP090_02985 [Moraxella bovis]|uniref:hypothetical protein n=1 Tax=Moraxella bovis TaxID=476 RepID=UPI0022273F00|nr:hypothetical protein [Moraxella bovis]UYZ68015.1 hypothetical protein LP122_09615 [Moraxella bovis]UYZ70390.1 hypothetical protein LP089_09725 [Moraxella bovis]UYZ73690.1 hypothetical protein LP105_02950 [Moraxella bovis]UZA13690.1 hypothetical protein LP102_09780 [Moraxella bovis]UZA27955.1 hypothetical protein LP119_02980 [Moraxella bovis]
MKADQSLFSGVMTDTVNASVGRTMAIEQTINYKGWKGSGYIIIDPHTGSGAYLIDGGTNGAAAFFLGKIMGLMLTIITLSILYTPQLYANPLTAAAMFGVMSTVTILLHFALFQIAFVWNAEVRKCFVGGLFVGLGPLGLFNKVGILGKILGFLGIASLEGYEFVRTNDKETCMKTN